jgi:hypothetical protein
MESSLQGVGLAALAQGVAFLYEQAGELLRRRRETKDREAQTGPASEGPAGEPVHGVQLEPPAGVFESVPAARPHPGVLDRVAAELLTARRDVEDYVLGTATLDPGSAASLQAVARLRSLLEEVYGTRLTLTGEARGDDGDGRVRADHVGVMISGNVHVGGDIAGRDINKRG